MPSLKAHFLPKLTTPDELAEGVVVVIDVLRATTVIVHALAAGARQVIPCLEVEDALQAAAHLPKGEAVLGGERGGLKIAGFDLGNSPDEFTPESVGGKTLVFTTTNGTRAMMACRQARRVFTGAFVNASAVVETLAGEDNVHLLCAGTRGEITREDVLCAGLLAEQLSRAQSSDLQVNDQLLIARDAWRAFLVCEESANLSTGLAVTLRSTQGGRNLIRLGLAHDIEVASHIDRFPLVPQLDLQKMVLSVGAVV
ncbi:MAG TPA: 2-phosphosulfolactate phosphatase [Pirellulales bacterium]|jgi:2-phosphosulfolactate phosphatase|nr:2-phosphosulfolactate phosphatase [Pirellulales bacterium]